MSPVRVPVSEGMEGEDVATLHDELTRLGLEIDPAERRRQFFGESTLKAVARFQKSNGLEADGVVDRKTAAAIARALGEEEPEPEPQPEPGDTAATGAIRGRVLTADRTSVPDVEVVAFTVALGLENELARTTADPSGRYGIVYDRAALGPVGKGPDLLVRARRAGQEIGASEIAYNAPADVRIDVVVATGTVERGDEHTRIVGALAPHVEAAPDRQRLGDLVETGERRDITYLANKTGWDARAVAMAAAADQLSQGNELPGELFYALFRAGLPADRDALARTRPEQATDIWKQSIADGVIDKALARDLPKFAERFTQFAATALLEQPAPIGVSPLTELLDAAGLDDTQKRQVAATYATAPDRDAFWSGVKEQLGPERAARVATAGKLGYLTVNNAPLTRKLADMADDGDPVALVRAGLYEPEAWREMVEAAPVPDEIPGAEGRERQANYADLLAHQLQLSYPTAVVAAMVERDEVHVADKQAGREAAAFLAEHQGRFELGAQPVAAYLRDNGLELGDAALATVKTLQRQYQLSPSHSTMRALSFEQIDSAYAACRYSPAAFVAQFGAALGHETARLVHAKAQQVHAAALNVATTYLMARTGPTLYSVPSTLASADRTDRLALAAGNGNGNGAGGNGNGGPHALADTTAGDVLAYATLEQLFGELDYCACADCRSVLGPAAYLVDLLLFCDKRRFNAAGVELPATYEKENPLAVLLSRRPDIAELQLTCENTNVALPYIDLVNEVLEHYVVHKSLAGFDGHNVDPEQTSEDLIAAPAFTDPAAYALLEGEAYPLELPFHRPLAGLRAAIARVGTTLADTMEALRASEAMTGAGATGYGWRDILVERLGIGRAEHRLLTDGSVPLGDLYGEDATDDTATIAVVGNAKTFARRLDLDYEEVVELVRTRFLNPQSWLLPRLDRLGISFATIEAHHDGQISDGQLEARLPSGLDTTPYGGDPAQWLSDHYAAIGTLLVLRDPDGSDLCSFDAVRLQHALSGTELTPVEARRLVRFVRLRRRLGWTVEQVDRTLAALWPAAQRALPADSATVAATKLDAGFAEVLLRIGHLQRVMDLLGLTVKRDLPRALALWAPIDTVGHGSLYHRMFLAPSIAAVDAVFAESPSGEVLTGAAEVGDHRPALEAAFNLKGGELDVILDAAGFDDQTDLTVANLSVVFRWALLARQLKLNVGELVALQRMTGLDLFAAPASPVPPLVRFLEIAQRLRDAGVRVPLLMYLFLHELPRGAPEPDEVLALAKALHDDLARIEQENAPVDDLAGDIARAKMALVYGQPTADRFMALVTGTVAVDVPYAQVQPTLDTTVTAAGPGLAYDHLAKRLRHQGLLTAAQRDAVLALAATTPALATAVGALYTTGQASTQEFFAGRPELAALFATVMARPADERTASVLQSLLPDLRRRLQELHLLQALASDADMTPADVDLLVRDPAVLHGAGGTTTPALDDLRAVGRAGASMTVYDGASATGTPSTEADAVDLLDYGGPDRPLPANSQNPAGAISGVWRAYVDAPASGFYNLSVEADTNASVELSVGGRPVTVAQAGDTWETQDAVELVAGTLTELVLTVENVRTRMTLRWQSAVLAREVVPTARLLPADLVDAFTAGYVRLLKAFGLAAQLGVDGAELARAAARPDLAVGGTGWLNALPTAAASAPAPATVQALLTAVLDLVGYVRLRRDLKVRDHRLLDLLDDPDRLTDAGTSARFELTGWTDADVAAVLTHLGLTEADLGSVDQLRRVQQVFDHADDIGVPAPTLVATVTNQPGAAQWTALQAALRARYDDESWPTIVQPVNDSLRDQQRDALVAYVLHHLRSTPDTSHIDTADKLFEWFLLDVEMEPCMQTSRIRQALSSVQLFIQRSLLNLETRVAASSIDPKRWSWMQRYRVWEANRKVFLMPENWLEPELRDDKSPLFRRLEGELLAGDITDESAATAMGRYLEGLAEVATLEVDGMYVEENASGAADDIVHVIGRTAGARRRYHYRRQSRGAWTAWEPIALDIEDTPVLPVVWNGRLLLFWLRVLDGPPANQAATTSTTDKPLTEVKTSEIRTSSTRRIQAMLQWSELFNGSWQPVRTSDANKPILVADLPVTPESEAFDRAKLQLWSRVDGDGSLVVSVNYHRTSGTHFRLYTPHSLPVRGVDEPPVEPGSMTLELLRANRDFKSAKGLAVDYMNPYEGGGFAHWWFTHDVLRRGYHGRVVEPRHRLSEVFAAPFFFQDRRHVLYVRPAPSIVSVAYFTDLGVQPEPPRVTIPDIPEIRLIPELDLRDLLPHTVDPYPPDVYHGGYDATPVGVLVLNANIRTEIASVGTFTYGDQAIAPGGALEIEIDGMAGGLQ